jgi:hypothetical protein
MKIVLIYWNLFKKELKNLIKLGSPLKLIDGQKSERIRVYQARIKNRLFLAQITDTMIVSIDRNFR